MMHYLDKYGWPVETLKGRPVLNFFRRLIHTRKIVSQWEHGPTIDPNVTTAAADEQRTES